MRNDTRFLNTLQVCQHHWDGSAWNINLYDFSNSQLTTGWWIHIIGSFNTATLGYTSSIMASNNLVV